jgi:ArsR family transcriptional regulator, arsenate/arsenite/antimonite-responsive transcriptional repressor
MKSFIKAMKALSDKNRVKIIKMLQHRELCVCEIKEGLGLAQPTVSKHLKVLEEAGFIMSRKEGLWVNYFLNDNHDNPYVSVFLENLKYWLEDDKEIVSLIKILPDLDRKIFCK